MKNTQQISKYIIYAITIVILCTWYIPSFSRGIDLSDTCFSLTKYKYAFTPEANLSSFTVYLSEIAGGILYHMYPTHQLLRLNLASAFFTLAGSFILIFKFRKELSLPLMLSTAFVSHLFVFSTLHIFNYNTTSIFNMTIAFVCLVTALQKESKKLLIISGLICGINIYFRLPNILHCCMFIGILWHEIICRKQSIKSGFLQTLYYIIGVASTFILGGIGGIVYLGPDKVITSITSTFNNFFTPSETNTHSGSSILTKLLSHLETSVKAWWFFWVTLIALLVIYYFTSKRQIQSKRPRLHIILSVIIGGILGILSFTLIWDNVLESYERLVSTNYHMWIILIFISVLVSIYGAFFYRSTDSILSTICILNIILIIVLPFGTDVGYLYYTHYCFIANIITLLVLSKVSNTQTCTILPIFPLALSFILCYTFITGSQFQSIYVYRDSSPEQLTQSVDIPELYGMKTSEFRAYSLTFLEEILTPYSEYEIITLGDNNIVPVITDMRCFFSTPWPDLAGFKEKQFIQELNTKIEAGTLPVIVFSARTSRMRDGIYPYRSAEKYNALVDVIRKNDYETIFYNDYYRIYVPVTK